MKFPKFFLVLIFSIVLCPIISSQTKIPQKWITRFEKSGYLETENYDQTMTYFKKLAESSPYAKMLSFGISPQGRKLYCLVVSKDRAFNPISAKKTGKPIIFINNGIHSGEIEGKDASMLLLREILVTKEKANLIDNTILLVIPIFSVDAHERSSPYNRINQNGPANMGWRTTAQNLNLNRDWTKADAPEMQAMLKLFSSWLPDFFVDTHTTDGADYQYTITYSMEHYQNVDAGLRGWIVGKLMPYLNKSVTDDGYLIAPYLEFKGQKIENGIIGASFSPRFSHSYAAAQNRPGLLIETHMLKPYKDRVFSTKSLLTAIITYTNKNGKEVIALNKAADKNSIEEYSIGKKYYPLSLELTDRSVPFHFMGIKAEHDSSWVSGTIWTRYTGVKYETDIPYYDQMVVTDSVQAPKKYLIPLEWGKWKNLIDRIKLHGIKVEQLKTPKTLTVTEYKFKNVKYANYSFEGRQRVKADYDTISETVNIPKGTYVIKTNQRTIRLILNLMEPKADDSFLQWGFFNSIFERKEYYESYVMEKIARQMMEKDPELKKEFEKKLATDENFRRNPRQRLDFFYSRSPYMDEKLNVYPILRVEK